MKGKLLPFYEGLNVTFTKGDIRGILLKHLEKELNGVIPPYGNVADNLLWAEIGLIIPAENGMIWICIPNLVDVDSFKKKYIDAMKLVPDDLPFSYNKLTLALFGNTDKKNDSDATVLTNFSIELNELLSECSNGDSNHKDCNNNNNKVVAIINELLNSKCDDADKWKKTVNDIDADCNSHSYFQVLRPGSFFWNESNLPGKRIIGGVVCYWKKLPTEYEIMYLRRKIINTIWLELGDHIDFLELEGVMSREIPALVMLSINNPFGEQNDHIDYAFKFRNKICDMLSSKLGPDELNPCASCKALNTSNVSGNYCDRSPNLDEYKGMFEIDKGITSTDRRNIFDVEGLFRNVCYYLDLRIDNIYIFNGTSIQLPYTPSWVFLTTVKLLLGRLDKENLKPKSHLIIYANDNYNYLLVTFESTRGNAVTCANKLRESIKDNRQKGNITKAIRNIRYGSLDAMGNVLVRRFPDNETIRTLLDFKSDLNLDIEIIPIKERICIAFKWKFEKDE